MLKDEITCRHNLSFLPVKLSIQSVPGGGIKILFRVIEFKRFLPILLCETIRIVGGVDSRESSCRLRAPSHRILDSKDVSHFLSIQPETSDGIEPMRMESDPSIFRSLRSGRNVAGRHPFNCYSGRFSELESTYSCIDFLRNFSFGRIFCACCSFSVKCSARAL